MIAGGAIALAASSRAPAAISRASQTAGSAASAAPPAAVPEGRLAALAAGPADSFAVALDAAIAADLAHAASTDSLSPAVPPSAETHPALELDRVMKSLPATAGILALVPEGDRVCSVLLTSKGAQSRVLDAPNTRIMTERIHSWMRSGGTARVDRHALRMLHVELIDPWNVPLRPLTRLIVVPSGSLRGIPFELLLMMDVEDPTDTSFPCLALRFDVTYEPTLGSRLLWAAPQDSASAALVRLGSQPNSVDRPLPRMRPGALLAASGEDPAGRFSAALEMARAGARGALLAWGDEDPSPLVDAFEAASLGGKRSDASAMRVFFRSAEPDTSLGPVERRARVSLFGSP